MTNRERLLAIMSGQSPDRIPWIPRLLIWHTAMLRRGNVPEFLQGLDLKGVEKKLGMGTPAREGRVFQASQEGDVEVRKRQEGTSVITEYHTPEGMVWTRDQSSDELVKVGIMSLEVEHMIKGPADYPPVEYLVSNTSYAATYDDYLAFEAETGEDGYPLVSAGDCPFHHFLQKLAGYQTGYYHLFDYPEKVEHLLKTMEEVERECIWPIVADSPARLILHGVHFDSTITPPPFFEQHITPFYQDLTALLHQEGKTVCMHADNDSRLILRHIKEAGYDMVETFTTQPQVSCTLAEAREAWGTDVIIWGAVPSVILESAYSDEAFEAYMKGLFKTIAPGDAVILGVADNVMPDARLDRLQRITQMCEEWGPYPINPAKIA